MALALLDGDSNFDFRIATRLLFLLIPFMVFSTSPSFFFLPVFLFTRPLIPLPLMTFLPAILFLLNNFSFSLYAEHRQNANILAMQLDLSINSYVVTQD